MNLVIGVVIAAFVCLIPGILWADAHHTNKVTHERFNESFEGHLIRCDRQTNEEIRYYWVDEEGEYRISILFINPWGEPIKVEVQ